MLLIRVENSNTGKYEKYTAKKLDKLEKLDVYFHHALF